MLNFFLVFLVSFVFSFILGFPVLNICRRFHFSQTILHYVDKHENKKGTPTMGGIIFIIPALITTLCFSVGENFLWMLFAVFVVLSYGLIGFLDDFIKIKFHKNEGLKPYQKIIGQVGIGLIVGLFVYFKLGSNLLFFGLDFDIGIFIIPFVIFFFVATTNSVNLLDGLDGLAGSVSFIYLLIFSLILILTGQVQLAILAISFCGALIAFLMFNCFPAKIFMGDTGSLAIGGAIAILCVLSKLELLLPLMGILFVITSLSDIIQVLHFKRTRTRVFKMAPIHHHFEKCGVHENRIVFVYIIVTLLSCLAVLIGYLALLGVL